MRARGLFAGRIRHVIKGINIGGFVTLSSLYLRRIFQDDNQSFCDGIFKFFFKDYIFCRQNIAIRFLHNGCAVKFYAAGLPVIFDTIRIKLSGFYTIFKSLSDMHIAMRANYSTFWIIRHSGGFQYNFRFQIKARFVN